MAAVIALGCEFILLGEFRRDLFWTRNQLHYAPAAFRTFGVCFNHSLGSRNRNIVSPALQLFLLLTFPLDVLAVRSLVRLNILEPA
jgi:hypothetical protein